MGFFLFVQCFFSGQLCISIYRIQLVFIGCSYSMHFTWDKQERKKKEPHSQNRLYSIHWKLLSYYNWLNADRNKHSGWIEPKLMTKAIFTIKYIFFFFSNFNTRASERQIESKTLTHGYHLVFFFVVVVVFVNAWKLNSIGWFLCFGIGFELPFLLWRCHIRSSAKLILKASQPVFIIYIFIFRFVHLLSAST